MKDIGTVEVEEHVRHPRMIHAFQQFVYRLFYLHFVHGIVPSYYLKQMAQTIIQRLEGVQSVMNLVEVREADSYSSWDNEEDAAFFDHSRFR